MCLTTEWEGVCSGARQGWKGKQRPDHSDYMGHVKDFEFSSMNIAQVIKYLLVLQKGILICQTHLGIMVADRDLN